MILYGKIVSQDTRHRSGVIKEIASGKTFVFSEAECKDNKLPKLGSFVSFRPDPEREFIDAAMLVCPELDDTHN